MAADAEVLLAPPVHIPFDDTGGLRILLVQRRQDAGIKGEAPAKSLPRAVTLDNRDLMRGVAQLREDREIKALRVPPRRT